MLLDTRSVFVDCSNEHLFESRLTEMMMMMMMVVVVVVVMMMMMMVMMMMVMRVKGGDISMVIMQCENEMKR